VQRLWDRIQARDWPAVGELLADDVVVEWPVSGERIAGRENFLRVNSEYPEGWSIHLLRLVEQDDSVVSECAVPHETMGEFRAVSWWTVQDGRIVAGREYWTAPGSDPVPEWRRPFTEPM
jgi:ketosteroid isomerase-like protein